MDKPLCRLCGVRHFLSSPHVFPDIVHEDNPIFREKPEKKIEPAAGKPTIRQKRKVKKKSKKKPFDRNKYQRDLMRKRRKEGKA